MGKRRGHGEGSIHLRPDGRWCAIVDLGRDANGKRKRKYVYGKTRKEVADQLKALHRDMAAGINLTPEQTTNVLRDATDQMDALAPPEEAGEDSKEEPEKDE